MRILHRQASGGAEELPFKTEGFALFPNPAQHAVTLQVDAARDGTHQAFGIDRAAQQVQLSDGRRMPYSGLVLAMGASPRMLSVPGSTATGVLALRIAGLRLTWRRGLGIVVGTVGLVVLVAIADWLRAPAARTHLGRFVQTALDGGAWDVVRRKALQNWEILTSSPATMALPVVAALLVWALARPARFRLGWLEVAYRRLPLLPDGLVTLGILLAISFAANDSGTSIPPSAALIALPLLVAVTARAMADDAPPGPIARRTGRR